MLESCVALFNFFWLIACAFTHRIIRVLSLP